jgi:hypothetical protein
MRQNNHRNHKLPADKKEIIFSPHAIDKLDRLKQSGISQQKAIEIVQKPDSVNLGYLGRKIAQSILSDDLLLRVIYEETDNSILIVTLYPAKRKRYE